MSVIVAGLDRLFTPVGTSRMAHVLPVTKGTAGTGAGRAPSPRPRVGARLPPIPGPGLAGQAQTVLGRIPGQAMGITLPHEHLLIDFEVMFKEPVNGSERGLARQPVSLANLGWVRHHFSSSARSRSARSRPRSRRSPRTSSSSRA